MESLIPIFINNFLFSKLLHPDKLEGFESICDLFRLEGEPELLKVYSEEMDMRKSQRLES